MRRERERVPEKSILKGRGQDVVRVAPYFVRPVRLYRGVEVQLSEPEPASWRQMPMKMTAEQEIKFEKMWPPARLKKFGELVVEKFDLKLSPRARMRRGGYQLFIPLWIGKGTEADHAKMRAVIKFVEKNAKKI